MPSVTERTKTYSTKLRNQKDAIKEESWMCVRKEEREKEKERRVKKR